MRPALAATLPAVQIAFVDEAQSGQGQVFVHGPDVLRSACNQWGQAAGGDGPGLGSHLGDHAFEDAIDQADITVIKTDLEVIDSSGSNDFGGLFDLDALQAGGAGEKRVGGDAKPRSDGAAEELAFFREHVEGGCGAHVDDDAGAAEALEGRDAVDDAVRAKVGGIVDENGNAGFDAGFDEDWLHLEIELADPA